jgi:hypothetical protein
MISGGQTDGRPGGLRARPGALARRRRTVLVPGVRRGPAHPAEPSREQATQGQSTMIACRAERLLTFPESVALTAAIGASNDAARLRSHR